MGGRRSSSPAPVGHVLAAVVPHLAERLLECRIRGEWRQLMGPEIARRSRPGELRNGALEIVTDNSPWLQELALREAELLRRLTDAYGAAVVRALRFSFGTLPPEVEAATPIPATGVDRPTVEERRMVDAAVAPIRDPDLQGQLRRLFEKACLATRVRTHRR